MSEAEFNRDVYCYFDKNGNATGINFRLFSNSLIEKYHFKTLRDTEQILYYKDGYYHFKGETIIREKAEEIFTDLMNSRKANEIIGHVRRSSFIDREEINNNPILLNLKNGILNIKTNEFKKHTPEEIITIRIPLSYEPTADCVKIKKFMSEIVSKENTKILEEIAGYCLYRRYFIKKAFLLNGSGDNGKSIFLTLLRLLIGKENYAAIPLQRLSTDRFSSAFLNNKMANIYGDLSSQALKDTGTFKMMTGGDPIPAEIKGGSLFTFINFAKLIFSANTIPDTKDLTDAFFERWIIVDFPYKFAWKPSNNIEKQKVDEETLLDELTSSEEMNGFFNLALESLKRLIDNRKFSYNKTSDEIEDKYKKSANLIYGFVKEWCEEDLEAQIPKSLLYNFYVRYSKIKKQPPFEIKKFGKEIMKFVPLIETHPYYEEENKQIEAWKGIKIKNKIEENIGNMGNIGIISFYLSLNNISINKDKEKNTLNTYVTNIKEQSKEEEEYNINDIVDIK